MNITKKHIRVIAIGLLLLAPSTLVSAGKAVRADVAVVRALYADKNDSWQENTRQQKRYFSNSLIAAFARDRACAEKSGSICALDFSPIWDSQDPGGDTATITPGTQLGKVTATLLFPGQNSSHTLHYILQKTRRGWRITDIQYPGRESLTQILQNRDTEAPTTSVTP